MMKREVLYLTTDNWKSVKSTDKLLENTEAMNRQEKSRKTVKSPWLGFDSRVTG